MAVTPKFELATLEVKKITGSISDDDLLQFYAYYKIAHSEDFSKAEKPSAFNFRAKYKYQAWEKEVNAGVTSEQAQQKYIELAESCKQKYGFDAKATKSANGTAISDADLKRFDELAKQTGKTY